jgi:hypothetical protein
LGYPGDGAEAALHLRVAIRAQEDALADLGTQALDAAGATASHAEVLLGWIDVMKLKCGHAAVVTAQSTTSTELSNEQLLDLVATANHAFLTTLAAPVVAARFSYVLGLTVACTQYRCPR